MTAKSSDLMVVLIIAILLLFVINTTVSRMGVN